MFAIARSFVRTTDGAPVVGALVVLTEYGTGVPVSYSFLGSDVKLRGQPLVTNDEGTVSATVYSPKGVKIVVKIGNAVVYEEDYNPDAIKCNGVQLAVLGGETSLAAVSAGHMMIPIASTDTGTDLEASVGDPVSDPDTTDESPVVPLNIVIVPQNAVRAVNTEVDFNVVAVFNDGHTEVNPEGVQLRTSDTNLAVCVPGSLQVLLFDQGISYVTASWTGSDGIEHSAETSVIVTAADEELDEDTRLDHGQDLLQPTAPAPSPASTRGQTSSVGLVDEAPYYKEVSEINSLVVSTVPAATEQTAESPVDDVAETDKTADEDSKWDVTADEDTDVISEDADDEEDTTALPAADESPTDVEDDEDLEGHDR